MEALSTQHKVFVLWNGGWDEFAIDPNLVRDLTPDEKQAHESGNPRFFPTFVASDRSEWVKGSFLQSDQNQRVVEITPNQCVRLLRVIRSGD